MSALLNPHRLEPAADPTEDELDALLRGTERHRSHDRDLAEAVLELLEAVYDEKRHPRWPPGSKDPSTGKNIGGEWMRVGERFMKDGHVWEIAHVAQGHIIANEASGDLDKAETRVFAPSQVSGHNTIADAKPAPLPFISPGEGKAYGTSNVPVVDAEAHDDHDPSIKLPAGSPITPAEWERFGKVDQLLYASLAERFGPWKQGFANKIVPKLMAEYSSAAQQAIKHGFSSQYGSSSGNSLSLQAVFSGGASAAAKVKYREARELAGDIREANAWELMNRLHAPDVSVIHWGGGSTHSKVVTGDEALMSGYSTSWSSSITQFGSTATTMAVAARHILLATDLSKPAGSHFQSEHEFATQDRLKLNPGIAHKFKSSSMGADLQKWFNDHFNASTGAMRPGSLIKAMHAHMKGEGTLPLPPPPAGLVYDNEGQKPLYHVPPPDVIKEAAKLAQTAGYSHGESADEALKPIESLGLEPGQLIEGHTVGKRYLVIADPGHPTGLAYIKLDGSNQVFHFGSMTSERRKLEATVKIPPPPAEKELPPFHPEQWTQAGELQPLGKMKDGEKVALQGDYLEVTGQAGGHTLLKSLTTGLTGKANAGHPTSALGPKPGFTPEGYTPSEPEAPAFTPKEGELALWIGHVVKVGAYNEDKKLWKVQPPWGGPETWAAPDTLSKFEPSFEPPAVAQKGDTFAFQGQKMTVTNVLKDGTVRAKAAVPGAKVQSFAKDHSALGGLFRPSEFTPGEKGKLGAMTAGTIFSGSPVKVRPYMVLSISGNKAHVVNLDTGGTSVFSKNKSYPLLIGAQEAKADLEAPPATDMTGVPHDQWNVGDVIDSKDLQIGDKFHMGSAGSYTVVGETTSLSGGSAWTVQAPSGGTHAFAKDFSSASVNKPTYAGHAEPSLEGPKPASPVEPGALPNAVEHGLAGYSSNAGPGGKYKHDKLNTLATGEHFFDKSGKLWKVKQAGDTPIITDGTANYHVDGKLRVKRAMHAKGGYTPLADTAPPVGSTEDEASNVAASKLVSNEANLEFGKLNLQTGHQFQWGGHVYEVTKGGESPTAINLDTNATKVFPQFGIPQKVSIAAPLPEPTPAVSGPKPGDFVPALHVKKGMVVQVKVPGAKYEVMETPEPGSPTVKLMAVKSGKSYDWKHYSKKPLHIVSVPPEPEPAPEPEHEIPSVPSFLTPGAQGYAKYYPTNTIAELPEGGLAYLKHDAVHGDNWFHIGGGPADVSDDTVITQMHVADHVPAPEDVQHTGKHIDLHDIRTGQTFFGPGGPFLMLGHGSEGVDAVNLKTGVVMAGNKDQHGTFELGTFGAPPVDIAEPQQTVGDLKKGDQFTIPDGYSGEGAAYEVWDPTPIHKPAYGDYTAYDTIKVRNLDDGSISEIATSLAPQSVVPAPTPPPAPAPKEPRAVAPSPKTVGELDVGDKYQFEGGGGVTFTVTSKSPHGITVNNGAEKMPLDQEFSSPPIIVHKEVPLEPAPSAMPITPYGSKWASGGKGVYDHIADLKPGEQFADKTGAKYTLYKHNVKQLGQPATSEVQAPTGGMITIPHTFEDAKGKTKPTRVKKLSTPLPTPAAAPDDVTHIDHSSGELLAYQGQPTLGLKAAKDKIESAKLHPGSPVDLGNGALLAVHPLDKTFMFIASDGKKYSVDGDKSILAIKVARIVSKPTAEPGQIGTTLHPVPPAWLAPATPLVQPVDDDHSQAMDIADEWMQNHGVTDVATLNKMHQTVADYKKDAPAASWAHAYQMGAAVFGGDDMTTATAQPLADKIDALLAFDKDEEEPPGIVSGPGNEPTTPHPPGDALFPKGEYKGETVADLGVGDVFKQSVSGTYWHVLSLNPMKIESVQTGTKAEPLWGDDLDKPIVITKKGKPPEPPASDEAKAIADTMNTHSPDKKVTPSEVEAAHAKVHDATPTMEPTFQWMTAGYTAYSDKHGGTGPADAFQPMIDRINALHGEQPPSPPPPEGFEPLPASMHPLDLGLEKGDQFIDGAGDRHQVMGFSDDGAPETLWWKADGKGPFGPMAWNEGDDSVVATAVKKAGSPAAVSATPAAPPAAIHDYNWAKLSGGKAAGGSQGAKIMSGPSGYGPVGDKWLLKTYGGDENRVATELLANAVYRALGVKVAEAGKISVDGKNALTYPLADGKLTHFSSKFGEPDDEKRRALGKDFMADALLANHDFVGLDDDNVLWNGNEPTRIDQGGTFNYRAMGQLKPFENTPTDVFSMLAKGQGKRGVLTSESSMRQQAKHIAETLTPEKIDLLVNQAPFTSQALRDEASSALKARVAWMAEFGDGQHDIPDDVADKLEVGQETPSFPEPAPSAFGPEYAVGDTATYATNSGGIKHGTVAQHASLSATQHAYVMDNGDKVDQNSMTPFSQSDLNGEQLHPGDTVTYDTLPGYAYTGPHPEVPGFAQLSHEPSGEVLGSPFALHKIEKASPSPPPEPDMEPAAEPEVPISPYGSKWASGGAFVYPHIADLEPGDQFRDKDGTLYRVASQWPKGTTKFGYTKAHAVGGWAHGAGPPAMVIPHTFTDKKGKTKLTRVKKVD